MHRARRAFRPGVCRLLCRPPFTSAASAGGGLFPAGISRRAPKRAPSAPYAMQPANWRLAAVERTRPFPKAPCRPPRRRPKARPLYRAPLPARPAATFLQKHPLRGHCQSRIAGVFLLLSASAAAHEGGDCLSAQWKKAIPAQTVYRKKPPSENGRFWVITASKILTGQKQRSLAEKHTLATGMLCRGADTALQKSACNRQTFLGASAALRKTPAYCRQIFLNQAQLCEKTFACNRHAFPGASAALRKNTRLLQADFSEPGTALRKNIRLQQACFAGEQTQPCKKAPATDRFCRSRHSSAKKVLFCSRQTLPEQDTALLENFRLASGPALPQGRRRRFSCVVAKAAHFLPQSIFAFPGR